MTPPTFTTSSTSSNITKFTPLGKNLKAWIGYRYRNGTTGLHIGPSSAPFKYSGDEAENYLLFPTSTYSSTYGSITSLSHMGENKVIAKTYSRNRDSETKKYSYKRYFLIFKNVGGSWSLVSAKPYSEELDDVSFLPVNDSQILLYDSRNIYLMTYY